MGAKTLRMKRVHVLALILAVLAVVGYPSMVKLANKIRYGAPQGEALTCDYAGKSYRENEQRKADDGCNVCACGANGWACTKIACRPGTGSGTIAGGLSYPGESLPALRICALDLKNDKEHCQQTTAGTKEYAITAPAGDYWVYAVLADEAAGKRAYYSSFVECGLKHDCKDHTPVVVSVATGGIVRADPQDWYAPGQFDLLNVTPSKFEYYTHNYYPTSVFTARTRGLAKVELQATPYPPQEGAPFSPIGEATLTGEERGVQIWTMPVTPGFQAMHVRALGTSEDGSFLYSRELRLVRPIETASASSSIE